MNQIKLQATLKTLADKGPGLYLRGPWVTPEVHEAFTLIMRANHTDDPAYHARNKCCAFFQGGSENPNGEYVFIEMWTFDPSKWEDFEKIVNEKVTPLIDINKWQVKIASATDQSRNLCETLMKETDVPMNWSALSLVVIFTPSDNAQRQRLLDLAKTYGLNVLPPR